MTSGVKLDHPAYPHSSDPAEDLASAADKLHAGLGRALKRNYAMELIDGRWRPVPASDLRARE